MQCRSCSNENITKSERHNFMNLVMGIIFCAIDVSYIGMGVVFYFFDMPFGAIKKYTCRDCGYSWEVD